LLTQKPSRKTSQTTHKSFNQSKNQSINQPTNQPTDRPTKETTNRPTEKVAREQERLLESYKQYSQSYYSTALQAGRSRVRFQTVSLECPIGTPNPSARTLALGSTQPVTEMSIRQFNKPYSWNVTDFVISTCVVRIWILPNLKNVGLSNRC